MRLWTISTLLIGWAASSLAQAQGFLLVRTDAAQKISYEFYEDVTINSQPRLRTPGSTIKSVDPNSYKNFGKLGLSEAPVFRRTSDGLLVEIKNDGGRVLVLPDGLRLRAPESPAEAWRQTAISAKKIKKDKNEEVLGLHQVLAILPSSSAPAGAAAFVTSPINPVTGLSTNFDSIDEHGAALIAAAEAFRNTPDAAAIVRYLASILHNGFSKFEDGGPYNVFLDTVRYAQIAQKAFPEQSALARTSAEIIAKRAWIEDITRMLTSLYSNRAWDSFLDRYLPFEKYQGSFPQLAEARLTAYDESTRFHAAAGASLSEQKKYADALEDLRLARLRDPDNRQLANAAEDTRMKAAREIAAERVGKRKGLAPDSTEAIRFDRALDFTKRYIASRQFKEAQQQMADAADLDKDSPKLLLLQARYYQATGRLAQALDYLDKYDENTVAKADRDEGETLRREIASNLDNMRRDNVRKLEELIEAGRYWEAEPLAIQSLDLDPTYDEFLYRAGVVSAVLRRKEAGQRLEDYLKYSNSRRGNPKLRDKAIRLLAILQTPRGAPNTQGRPNWFSGKMLRGDVYYCPESLAFQPRIESIQGKKMGMRFEWAEGKLRKISTTFEDLKAKQEYLAKLARQPGAPDAEPRALFFGYQSGSNAVYRVAEGQTAPADPAGEPVIVRDPKNGAAFSGASPGDGAWKYPVLLDHPRVAAEVVERLDGEITLGVAGNSYFNPFVWDGLHLFRLHYDSLGRVESAREIGTPNLVRFEWRNEQLIAVSGYEVGDGRTERSVYHRSITYSGNDLASEAVDLGAKNYRIVYQGVNGVLQGATIFDVDGSDKKVRFLP